MRKDQSTNETADDFPLDVVLLLCGGLPALIAGGFAACWLVPFAYAQRGYFAIGGEWLVVCLSSLVAFQVGTWLFGRKQGKL